MLKINRFVINSALGILHQLVVLGCGLIVPQIILKCYGSEVNGFLTSINQFISYFMMVEAGLAAAAIFMLYKPLADMNIILISDIVSTSRKLYIKTGLIFSLIVILFSLLVPVIIKSESLSNAEMVFLVLILGISGSLDFFALGKYRVLFTADQNNYIISIASIASVVTYTFMVYSLASSDFSIVMLRLVTLISIFVRSLILYVFRKKKYKGIDFKSSNEVHLPQRWDAMYLQLLNSAQNAAPIVIATFFTSLKLVSVYSIYNFVIFGLNNLLGVLTSTLSSVYGELIAKEETNVMRVRFHIFEKTYHYLIAIIFGVTYSLLLPFVKLYTESVTDVNYYIPTLSALFVINAFVNNLKSPYGMLIISGGYYKETKIQSTIQALIIILPSIVLVNWIGLEGILISLIASNVYRSVDLIFFVRKKFDFLNIKQSVISIFVSSILFFSFVILSKWVMDNSIDTFAQWLLSACGFTSFCILVTSLILIVFDRNFIKSLAISIRSRNI